MRFSARYLPAVLLTLLSLAPSLCAQSTTKQAVRVPRGSVSGRVTINGNGVAGVAIGLRKAADAMTISREPFLRVTTDHDGFYRFTNLAPGNYSITPSAPAFVMARKDPQSKTVLVGEDENVENINFALVRGGVITGRVTDADGRPVIEQHVNLYKVENLEMRSRETPLFLDRFVQTDDRGMYRFFGLSPGRYKVAVGRADENAFNFNTPERANYQQVFHPDATDHAKATAIEVSEGSEASKVDIALGPVMQIFSASGVAIDEKGMPVPNVRLEVQRKIGQRIDFVNAFAASNRRGEFVSEGLIPGKYGIAAYPDQGSDDMHAEPLSFDITDQDIGGLTVRLSKGANLTGFVVLENEDKSLFSKLTEVQLRAFSTVADGSGYFAISPIGPDGSFRLAGLAGGTFNLMLGSMTNPVAKGFIIARVERDGIVSPSPRLEIKRGEQLTGVRVIVSYGTATLRGMVKLENGSLPEGARILNRLVKPGEAFSNFRPLISDERGHFLMDTLPPGTYELSTTITGTLSTQPRTVKREVTLQDGQVTELTITIDMSAPVKP